MAATFEQLFATHRCFAETPMMYNSTNTRVRLQDVVRAITSCSEDSSRTKVNEMKRKGDIACSFSSLDSFVNCRSAVPAADVAGTAYFIKYFPGNKAKKLQTELNGAIDAFLPELPVANVALQNAPEPTSMVSPPSMCTDQVLPPSFQPPLPFMEESTPLESTTTLPNGSPPPSVCQASAHQETSSMSTTSNRMNCTNAAQNDVVQMKQIINDSSHIKPRETHEVGPTNQPSANPVLDFL